MEELFTLQNGIAFLTLAALEIVLGIDNIVFISILTGKLPPEKRAGAMRMGLGIAMVSRIMLLFAISWIMKMQNALFTIMGHAFSLKDLILIAGGLFLMVKSVHEIHEKIEHGGPQKEASQIKAVSVAKVMVMILLIDLVFSIDSVITAVGMVDHITVMVAAVIVAVIVMMLFANAVGNFVNQHPTIKILALSFLMLIGILILAEGFHAHLNRGYVYFAMGFSLTVELVNMRIRGHGNATPTPPAVDLKTG